MEDIFRRCSTHARLPWAVAQIGNLSPGVSDNNRKRYYYLLRTFLEEKFRCHPNDIAVTFGPDAPTFAPVSGPIVVDAKLYDVYADEDGLVELARKLVKDVSRLNGSRITLVTLSDTRRRWTCSSDTADVMSLERAHQSLMASLARGSDKGQEPSGGSKVVKLPTRN